MYNSKYNMFESTATGKEIRLIRDFAYDVCEELGDDWEVVDSSIGDPVAILHIPTNTTYHIDIDATSRLDSIDGLKVVFAEQPNSIGSSYSSGSCYTFDIDHAVKLLNFNAKRMEKWLERHPYESMKCNYSLEHKYESDRRNMSYRFESAKSGEDLYNEITDDLTSLEESIQDRFEDICKSKYNYKYVRARIAIEDGIENYNGDPMLRFYLFADSKAFGRYMRDGDTRDNISELTYSFRDDGLYEDDEYFNGTTEKDLIDAVAESFAKSLDDSEY